MKFKTFCQLYTVKIKTWKKNVLLLKGLLIYYYWC